MAFSINFILKQIVFHILCYMVIIDWNDNDAYQHYDDTIEDYDDGDSENDDDIPF